MKRWLGPHSRFALAPHAFAVSRVGIVFAVGSVAALLLGGVGARAQNEIPSAAKPTPGPTSTLTTGTQLVIVDVTVTDKLGRPIHGLKQGDFVVSENHAPQTPKAFEEHAALDRTKEPAPVMPKLPAGTFTDFQPVAENAPLNVLLLDALNTPMKDQAYVRYQLQQYVKKAQPGTRIAIFGLTSRLILLQGFSSDPEVLKNVVEHKLLPRASNLLDDPTGSGVLPDSMSSNMADIGASAEAVANMQQFEAETASFQTQLRTTYTIDAFTALARYLGAFPGRKNLIWFSGAFPLTIFPDSTLEDPFSVAADASGALRNASSELDRARVAVYPVDARGLEGNPVFSAANSGRGYTRNPGAFAAAASNWSQNNAEEHMAMDQIADDTGGHAFYNTNDLAAAVEKAIDAGSNFYTLAYAPTNRKQDGGYRNIHLELTGAAAGAGYRLSYRHGYYAAEAPKADRKSAPVVAAANAHADAGANGAATATTNATAAAAAAALPNRPGTYDRTAMERGAPAPSEILFKVRVLPATAATEDTLAPNNNADPEGHMRPPFRRLVVDYAALTAQILLRADSEKVRHGEVEFVTLVYDRDGRLLNANGSTVQLALKPETYAALRQSGMNFRMVVSVPAKQETFLRIGIHDLSDGHFGVVEVPTESVSHLAPLVDPVPAKPAPAGAPSSSTSSPAAGAAAAPSSPAAPAAPAATPRF